MDAIDEAIRAVIEGAMDRAREAHPAGRRRNLYPGRCACDVWVQAEEGFLVREGEGWAVQCQRRANPLAEAWCVNCFQTRLASQMVVGLCVDCRGE